MHQKIILQNQKIQYLKKETSKLKHLKTKLFNTEEQIIFNQKRSHLEIT